MCQEYLPPVILYNHNGIVLIKPVSVSYYHGTFNEPNLDVMYVQPLEGTPDMTGS